MRGSLKSTDPEVFNAQPEQQLDQTATGKEGVSAGSGFEEADGLTGEDVRCLDEAMMPGEEGMQSLSASDDRDPIHMLDTKHK